MENESTGPTIKESRERVTIIQSKLSHADAPSTPKFNVDDHAPSTPKFNVEDWVPEGRARRNKKKLSPCCLPDPSLDAPTLNFWGRGGTNFDFLGKGALIFVYI